MNAGAAKYDAIYQGTPDALGTPSDTVTVFMAKMARARIVLDHGAGQGRVLVAHERKTSADIRVALSDMGFDIRTPKPTVLIATMP